MSWQDGVMAEQEAADALNYMGEAEWRDMQEGERKKKRSEYNAKYWAAHKERISEKRRKAYKEDPTKVNERNKRWLENNRERWNAYQREYRRRHNAIDKPAEV